MLADFTDFVDGAGFPAEAFTVGWGNKKGRQQATFFVAGTS